MAVTIWPALYALYSLGHRLVAIAFSSEQQAVGYVLSQLVEGIAIVVYMNV